MNALAQRFKSAREMKGLSLQELSDLLDKSISKQGLHKYETGEVVPDHGMIKNIATVLELKPDYFYREHVTNIDYDKVSYRKLADLSKKEQHRIIEITRDVLDRYLELENTTGKSIYLSNPLSDFSIKSYEDVEMAAKYLREIWELGSGPIYNVLELLEGKGFKIIEFSSDDSIDGISAWIQDKIPVIGLNLRRRVDLTRYRFTTLHELAHLLLNIEEYPVKDQEKFCNYFAGAMLLPKHAIEVELGLKRKRISLQELVSIKKQYGISVQAIVYRLKDLRVITQTSYANFFRYMSANNMRKDESKLGKYGGEEEVLRFDHLLGQALIEERISVSKAAALKNLPLNLFRKEFILG
ncbi:MAG: XRE family transcriptional regulator [Balneolales bacterium]|nr:XRE family transcriptional regulator [Balneolales bacterium]